MAASTWLLALTLRSTVVLAVALALGPRRMTAGARHRLLTVTAIALLLLPALPLLLPRWELSVLPRWMEGPSRQAEGRPGGPTAQVAEPVSAGAADLAAGEGGGLEVHAPAGAARSENEAAGLGLPWGAAGVGVWLIGVLASLIGLARALRRERRLLAASLPLGGPWQETLAGACRSLAVTRPVRLLACEEIQTPLTGGWRRPAVLLPASAALWSDERRRVVALHELVHVVRGDALRRLAWRVVAAVYWFHPLARLAEREARVVGEQACDEAVLDLGTRPSAYARHLLEIAESLRARPLTFASALPMVERSQLERRLVMILDPNRTTGRGPVVAAVSLALLVGTVFVVGAATPRPQAGSSAAAAPASPAVEATPPAEAVAAAVAVVSVVAAPAEPAHAVCLDGISGTFNGTFTEGPSGTDLNGVHNGAFALQQDLGGGRRLCARVHGPVRFDERDGSIRDLPRGSSVLIETRGGRGRSQRMLITAEQGDQRYQWWLNGTAASPDEAARGWLTDALEALAAFRAIGSIQGQVGSLQGEIGSIQGEVGSLQGEIGSIQGEEGSLQGKIGSIQGEEGSLQGDIGSQQGAIGSLEGSRWQASAAQQARIDREIQAHEAAMKKLEAEMASRGFSKRIAEAEAELRAFQESERGRIAELEREIEGLQAGERIGRLERQIEDLHADDRIREIERRMKPALERLRAHIQRLGS